MSAGTTSKMEAGSMFELMRMIQELTQKVDQQVTLNCVGKYFLKGRVHTKRKIL